MTSDTNNHPDPEWLAHPVVWLFRLFLIEDRIGCCGAHWSRKKEQTSKREQPDRMRYWKRIFFEKNRID
jgi:hypothetical protein